MKRPLLVSIFVAGLLTGCSASDQAEVVKSFQEGVCLQLGENFLDAHQYELAEKQFKAAQTIAESSKDKTELAEVMTRLGQTYDGMGKSKEALEALKQADTLYGEQDEIGFLFSIDRRVWKECLMSYEPLLKKTGNEKEAASVALRLAAIRKKLGPMEEARELTLKTVGSK